MILDTEYRVGGVRFKYNNEKSIKNSNKKDRGYDHRIVATCLLNALDSMDNPGYPGQVLEFTYIDGVMFTVATDDGDDGQGGCLLRNLYVLEDGKSA